MDNLANGWLPIERFRPETFPDEKPFLVWLVNKDGDGWWEAAKYTKDYTEDGKFIGPRRIAGSWRYVDESKHLEPVAFQADREGLRGPNNEEGRLMSAYSSEVERLRIRVAELEKQLEDCWEQSLENQ